MLYAWRGYNGVGRPYPPNKYYEWEKIKECNKVKVTPFEETLYSSTTLNDLNNVQEEIREHIIKATVCFNKVAEQFPPVNNKLKSENTVKAEIKTTFVDDQLVSTEINDVNINEMKSSDILHHIGNTEAAIDKLKKHNGKSEFVKQETARLKKFVKEAYALLDNKFAKPVTK